ncbi:UNVERIFIED_CONTAM: Acidic endochitinase [Siphonaria sp. JEL0065]|nr:Acidic endochitinase [Siphonaria sp. JEL0065]
MASKKDSEVVDVGQVALDGKADTSRMTRGKLIVIGVATLVLIVSGALIGYFIVKNKTSSDSSAESSSDSTPSGATNTTAPPKTGLTHRLIGYYGANAIANGVDIVKGTNGRITAPSNYQLGLSSYCDTGYYHTINLAFLNIFGGGNNQFRITFGAFHDPNLKDGTYIYNGNGAETNGNTTVNTFLEMGKQIQHCQAKGVKIVMSLGGDKISAYQYVWGDGVAYANLFYNIFLEGTAGPIRPFGPGVILDGIELDVEKNDNPTVWTPEMISFVQTLRQLSPKTILAVVPQCFLNGVIGKDINVGDVINATAPILDYIIIQYYNNPVCSYPFNFNYAAWKSLYSGPIVVGLAGDWTSAISGGFLEPGPLQAVYDMVGSDDQFLGFSVYDVSSSNTPALSWTVQDYGNPSPSTYSKTLSDVLSGVKVGSGFPPQGPQTTDLQLSHRCGGTWIYANATCTKTCQSNSDCGREEQCFPFISNC